MGPAVSSPGDAAALDTESASAQLTLRGDWCRRRGGAASVATRGERRGVSQAGGREPGFTLPGRGSHLGSRGRRREPAVDPLRVRRREAAAALRHTRGARRRHRRIRGGVACRRRFGAFVARRPRGAECRAAGWSWRVRDERFSRSARPVASSRRRCGASPPPAPRRSGSGGATRRRCALRWRRRAGSAPLARWTTRRAA